MFRVSRRLDYGLQLLIALGAHEGAAAQSTAALAAQLRIPLPFLHQIGHTLMQNGIIKASPGPRGGIRLNRPSDSITLYQIVESLEGPVSVHPCIKCDDQCDRGDVCSTKRTWIELEEMINGYMNRIRLKDLIDAPQLFPDFHVQTKQLTHSEFNI